MDPIVNPDHGDAMFRPRAVDPNVHQMLHHHHPHLRQVDLPVGHGQHGPGHAASPAGPTQDAPMFEATGTPFSSPMLRGSYSA